jgi:hypothetical protein
MGGALGKLYTFLIQNFFEYQDPNEIRQNALLGAAAMLSGYCRLGFSLNVMMLETTQSISLFIPMLITILVSYMTARFFNLSLYNRALRNKQIPMLKDLVPKINENLRAKLVMKDQVISLSLIPTVEEIGQALIYGYKCFPVLNQQGQLVGNISSNFLVVLIQQKAFYSKTVMPELLGKITAMSSDQGRSDSVYSKKGRDQSSVHTSENGDS